ncbi:MAG TPA: NAD(P)-dependent alcohol dehydrogenase [bacterium]|nr:NAD(P)-dependent alcohol dehydrogenase [bacterium]
MKAITFDRYGSPDVLRLQDIEKPVVTDDMLVRIRAASANPYDWHFLTGKPYIMRLMLYALRKPRFTRLGADLAGQVEAVGRNVTRFRPGDAVFGMVNDEGPDKPFLALASFAEYVCVSEDRVALKPANLTFEQAAAVPVAALTALKGLRDIGRIGHGQKVLINGASGGVGTFAVQIAKSFGAEVTGVCSTRNVDLVRSLGAGQVFDYTREDFVRGGQRYDLVLDLVGNRSLSECMRVLKPTGVYLMSFGLPDNAWLGPFPRLLKARVVSRFVAPKLVELAWQFEREDLLVLTGLLEAGTVTPVIDRSYPLSEAPEGMRYLEAGHARGKVILTM